MHEQIEKFTLEGIVGDDADIQLNKEELIHWLESDMRDEGYAPVLDIDPQYSHQYDSENNFFRFTLTLYGAYIGEEEAWNYNPTIPVRRMRDSSTLPRSTMCCRL